MSSRKTVLGVFGSLFALVAIGLLIAGGVVIWATGTHRTSEGFFTSPTTEATPPVICGRSCGCAT